MATIVNDRDIALRSRGEYNRIMAPSIIVGVTSTPAGSSYFSKLPNATAVTPSQIVLATSLPSGGNYTAPIYKWEYSRNSDPFTWINLGITTANLTITNTNFITHVGTGTSVNYRVTVSQVGWVNTSSIYVMEYSKSATVTPFIVLSKESILLPVSTTGTINYTGSGTDIRVSINNVYIPYDVAGTAGPNTFTVTAVGSTTPNTVTLGSVSTVTTSVTNDTRRFADISGMSATVNPGSITYTITVRDADGTATIFTKTQSVVVSLTGANAKTLSITADSYIFKADSDNTLISSVIKLTANKQNTTNTVNWSLSPSITLYTAATGGTTTTTGDIVYLRSSDFGSNSSTIVTASIPSDSITDTCSILRVRDGSSAVTAILSNPLAPLSTTSAGVVTYTGSGTTIQVYEGSTLRTITAVSAAVTNITAGALSGLNTTTATYGDHSAITQDNAKITYTITFTKGDGTSATTTATQTLTKSKQGSAGTSGDKYITISAFRWATGTAPTATGTATFTWSSQSYNTPPTGWSNLPGAAPGTGYTLYQVNLIVSDIATATTTAINWANGTIGTIGYRQDGSIGLTGDSHRTAYVVTTSSTVPGTVTPGTGNVPPTNVVASQVTGWSFTATSTLSAGQYMYQVDGIYTNGANIAWGNPYLSNLKVGSLSAISADLGSITAGSITGVTITGSTIQTSASAKRIVLNDATNTLQGYNAVGTNTVTIDADASANGLIGATISTAGVYAIYGKQTANSYAIVAENTNTNPASVALYGNNSGAGIGVQALSKSAGTALKADALGSGYGADINSSTGTGARIRSTAVDTGIAVSLSLDGGITQIARSGGPPAVGYATNYFNSIVPVTNNGYYCGYTGNVWAGIYSQTALVVVSDAREKTDIENCDLGLNFINNLRPVTYKSKIGHNIITNIEKPISDVTGIKPDPEIVVTSIPGARRHYGLIAQEVKSVIGNLDCAFWVSADVTDPEAAQSLRYEELIAPLIKAVQELSAQNTALEQRISILEAGK